MDTALLRWRGATVTRGRALQVGGILLGLLLGLVLPYLTLEYLDATFATVRRTARLLDAGTLLGLDPTYFPSYDPAVRSEVNLALNVAGVAPPLQLFGSLIALVTCWGLFFDEINKFLWWPLHLSGYLLVAVPIPLYIGAHLLDLSRITATIGPGWVSAALTGIVILVLSFRSRSRIDTYGGF